MGCWFVVQCVPPLLLMLAFAFGHQPAQTTAYQPPFGGVAEHPTYDLQWYCKHHSGTQGGVGIYMFKMNETLVCPEVVPAGGMCQVCCSLHQIKCHLYLCLAEEGKGSVEAATRQRGTDTKKLYIFSSLVNPASHLALPQHPTASHAVSEVAPLLPPEHMTWKSVHVLAVRCRHLHWWGAHSTGRPPRTSSSNANCTHKHTHGRRGSTTLVTY